MAEAFFSQSWFRVANRAPRLAHHLAVHRHRYRGGAWYVVEDTVTGKVHRLSPAAYVFAARLDGKRTVEEVWLELVELQGENAPSQDDVIHFLSQLHSSDLLRGDAVANIAELDERHSKQAKAYLRQSLMNPMSLRVPVLNPDSFLTATAPYVRPLFSWFGLIAFIVLTAYAGLLAAANWDALSENIYDRLLSANNILILLIVYPLMKTVHELAHGYTAKFRGAAVPEFGLMFLVFFPVPYVDASGAAAFRDKGHRMLVGAAGILAEMTVASIAMILWTRTSDGFERALLFNIMAIGGVSTLIVNGNPLLKFDGYFIFTDLIETPNLAQRASKYVQYLVDTYVFGVTGGKPPLATTSEKWLFVVYAPTAFVYRIFLTGGIAFFVAKKYLVIGVVLAAWMVVQSFIWPAVKGLKYVISAPRLQRQRGRAAVWVFGTVTGLAGILAFLPVPSWYVGDGIVWLPDSAFIRAGTEGFARQTLIAQGGRVELATEVVALGDDAREAQLQVLAWRVRELQRKIAKAIEDPFLARTTRIDLDNARAELNRELDRRMKSHVRSAAAGLFQPALSPGDFPERHFAEGDLVGYVLPERPSEIRAVVPDHVVDQLRNGLRGVELLLEGERISTAPVKLLREIPQVNFVLPSAALSQSFGGPIPTDPRDTKGVTALARFYVFDLALPEQFAGYTFGDRVLLKYAFDPEPAGYQIFRYIRRVILREFYA